MGGALGLMGSPPALTPQEIHALGAQDATDLVHSPFERQGRTSSECTFPAFNDTYSAISVTYRLGTQSLWDRLSSVGELTCGGLLRSL